MEVVQKKVANVLMLHVGVLALWLHNKKCACVLLKKN